MRRTDTASDTALDAVLEAVHDASLLVWTALAVAGATGHRRAKVLPLVVAVNLISGAPAAARRLLDGRRDLVAVLAPPTVGCALLSTLRSSPRWAPAAATVALLILRIIERNRRPAPGAGER